MCGFSLLGLHAAEIHVPSGYGGGGGGGSSVPLARPLRPEGEARVAGRHAPPRAPPLSPPAGGHAVADGGGVGVVALSRRWFLWLGLCA